MRAFYEATDSKQIKRDLQNGMQDAINSVPGNAGELIENGDNAMNNFFLNVYVKLQSLMHSEEGQDLVEYALVVALIAFGATVGMKALADGINTAFQNVSTQLAASIS